MTVKGRKEETTSFSVLEPQECIADGVAFVLESVALSGRKDVFGVSRRHALEPHWLASSMRCIKWTRRARAVYDSGR